MIPISLMSAELSKKLPAPTKSQISKDLVAGDNFSCNLSFPNESRAKKAIQKIESQKLGSAQIYSSQQSPTSFSIVVPFHSSEEYSEKFKQHVHSTLKKIAEKSGGIFQSCEEAFPQIAKKPAIYLYPTKPQDVEVRLNYRGTLITSYPDFDPQLKGWRVTAYPDGHLINHADRQEYSYLFWEGVAHPEPVYDLSQGFLVKGKEIKNFLQSTLKKLGLTPRESNEFIVYWLPRMQNNSYNLIHFAGKEYTQTALLEIKPAPNSLLRVFMVFQGLKTPIKVKSQKLNSFQRNGFTVVEWGGTEILR